MKRKLGNSIPAPSTLSQSEWPPDYDLVKAWREQQLVRFEDDPELIISAKEHYKNNCVDFINDWCITYDPRKLARRENPKMPFILFERQDDLVEFILKCINGETDGLVEKCRDAGVTWIGCAISVWLWNFHEGSAVGWGSRKQELVDRLGDPSSIFEKIRMLITNLPEVFLPRGFTIDGCLHFMRIVNPENGSTIIGEIGDDIGRGGRTLVYFKDESAHYARPERIEAALSENTRCQIDISSVNSPTTVFQRKRDVGTDWNPGQEVVKYATNVFVFDWSDHPEKTQEWHDAREAKARSEGLYHTFAQEVDRNPYAAVEGIIIDARWFDAAVDAHIKLGIEPSGAKMGALDVADEGLDSNALSIRLGILLLFLQEWGERDTGETTRRTVGIVKEWIDPDIDFILSYDCIGVGAGVKAEANRLKKDERVAFPKNLIFTPWNAASAVQDPYERVIPGDDNSPLNRDHFGNIKAQAWWSIARRFERTYRAVNEPYYTWDPDDLIAIPKTLPLIAKLKKELCQPTMAKNTHLKMIVNKTPNGMRSPNLADTIVMNYFPIKPRKEPSLGVGGITIIRGSSLGSIQRI